MDTPPLLDALQLISFHSVLLETLQLTVRVDPFATVPPPLQETDISSAGETSPFSGGLAWPAAMPHVTASTAKTVTTGVMSRVARVSFVMPCADSAVRMGATINNRALL